MKRGVKPVGRGEGIRRGVGRSLGLIVDLEPGSYLEVATSLPDTIVRYLPGNTTGHVS
jgi:hypothetical protein